MNWTVTFLAAAAAPVGAPEGNILTEFGVNPQNFIAQIIVFVTVLFVLRKFAYGPILTQLEERKRVISESLENSEKVKQALADAERTREEVIRKANEQANRLVSEAQTSAAALAERRAQEAAAQAEAIVQKAREAAELDRDRMMGELRREIGRLVVDTTAKVTGKVLTPEDQRRLNEETARELAA